MDIGAGMSTLVIWIMGAGLLLINIILRTRLLRLEASLKALRDPQEYLSYLHNQATVSYTHLTLPTILRV